MELRDYQKDCLKAIERHQNDGFNRQMVVLPTGAGKTVIFAELIKQKKLKTLVIAHRIELLEQAIKKIKDADPKVGIGLFCGEDRCYDRQVTVASIQTASRDLDLLKAQGYELLIIDEAHHSAAKTYRELISHLGFQEDKLSQCPDSSKLMVGFTATPKRGDKTRLDDIFQKIVFNVSIRKLIKQNYLVQPEGIHIKVGIDLRKLKKKLGEFDQESLKKVMQTEDAMNIVIASIKKYASDRHGIVFGVDIEHSEKLMEEIQLAGFTCQTVHSKMSLAERRQSIKLFETGKLQFITNPMILTEGFDCPRMDCMINAAPTMNNTLYIQKAGRALRIHPEKQNALLMDFGRNSRKHSICTAVSLTGIDLAFKVITQRDDLDIKIPKKPPKKELIGTEETAYDPTNSNAHETIQHQAEKKRHLTEKEIFNQKNWPIESRYISERQIEFMQKLARSTNTLIPRKNDLKEMGLNYASRIIDYLIEKKKKNQTTEPLTERQANYLMMLAQMREINIVSQDVCRLTKYEARRIIGRYQQSQARSYA